MAFNTPVASECCLTSNDIYNGEFTDFLQRTGEGEQTWSNDSYQKYEGNFFQDSLHGQGTYTLLNKKDFLVEGSLYANNFHGYCSITYSDQTYFEGLMRNNERFGPGVYTYPDKRQDVGLWSGDQLMKLCYTVLPDRVPKLAYSTLGKSKLMRFKKLVPLPNESDDITIGMLNKLGASPTVLEQSHQIYNPYVRNKNSSLFDRKLHDQQIYGTETELFIDVPADLADLTEENSSTFTLIESGFLEEVIQFEEDLHEDVIIPILNTLLGKVDQLSQLTKREQDLTFNKKEMLTSFPDSWKTDDIPLRKIRVTEVLAWNNEDGAIEMLQHTFRNINTEKNVSFRVRNLLIGDRSYFLEPGDQEQACVKFLQECCNGNYRLAAELLVKRNLNPDVSDLKGNSGVMFAAANDKWRVMRMLCNFGGNLDKLNDDGLSPLNMCILRYVAVKGDVTDWERAFLGDTEISESEKEEIQLWRPHDSLINLRAMSMASNLEEFIIKEDLTIKNNLLHKQTILEMLNISIEEAQAQPIFKHYFNLKNIGIDAERKDFQQPYEIVENTKQAFLFKIDPIVPPKAKVSKKESKAGSKKGSSKKSKTNTSNKSSSEKVKKSKSKSDHSKSSKKSSKSGRSKTDKKHDLDEPSKEELIKREILKVIFKTIKMLLGLGCDPNYSSAPLPALHLAIYGESKELLRLLMESGADPNMQSLSDGLTTLHVVACLPFSSWNTELFQTLLEYGANPNQLTNSSHWEKEKTKLLGKITPGVPEVEDYGKTAIHILAMRYDFETDSDNNQLKMIKLLLDHGANSRETYLGHTPFSIAILRGNTKLMKFLIESKAIDPYEVLGAGMGNPMTVLILKRYQKILPFEKVKAVYDLLCEYHFNPLKKIDGLNVIEFLEREYPTKRKTGDKKKAKKSKSKLESSTKSKSKSKSKAKTPDNINDYLIAIAKSALERHILGEAFKNLRVLLMIPTTSNYQAIRTLVQFFDKQGLHKTIQTLIDWDVIENTILNMHTTFEILSTVKRVNVHSSNVDKIFKELNWEAAKPDLIMELIPPEIDSHESIYKVCFNCGKSLNRMLIPCTICGLIYFCSQDCNRTSIKQKGTIHKCRYLFYDEMRKRLEKASQVQFKGEPLTSQLHETMGTAKEKLLGMLMRKCGKSAAEQLLETAFAQGHVDIDYLFRMCAALQDAVVDMMNVTYTAMGIRFRFSDITHDVFQEYLGKDKDYWDDLIAMKMSQFEPYDKKVIDDDDGLKKGEAKKRLGKEERKRSDAETGELTVSRQKSLTRQQSTENELDMEGKGDYKREIKKHGERSLSELKLVEDDADLKKTKEVSLLNIISKQYRSKDGKLVNATSNVKSPRSLVVSASSVKNKRGIDSSSKVNRSKLRVALLHKDRKKTKSMELFGRNINEKSNDNDLEYKTKINESRKTNTEKPGSNTILKKTNSKSNSNTKFPKRNDQKSPSTLFRKPKEKSASSLFGDIKYDQILARANESPISMMTFNRTKEQNVGTNEETWRSNLFSKTVQKPIKHNNLENTNEEKWTSNPFSTTEQGNLKNNRLGKTYEGKLKGTPVGETSENFMSKQLGNPTERKFMSNSSVEKNVKLNKQIFSGSNESLLHFTDVKPTGKPKEVNIKGGRQGKRYEGRSANNTVDKTKERIRNKTIEDKQENKLLSKIKVAQLKVRDTKGAQLKIPRLCRVHKTNPEEKEIHTIPDKRKGKAIVEKHSIDIPHRTSAANQEKNEERSNENKNKQLILKNPIQIDVSHNENKYNKTENQDKGHGDKNEKPQIKTRVRKVDKLRSLVQTNAKYLNYISKLKNTPLQKEKFANKLKCQDRKGRQFPTLPSKCQFLIEELARLFPDFDFSKVLSPFVVYSDGQLYYRFLDKAPLFLRTFSNC